MGGGGLSIAPQFSLHSGKAQITSPLSKPKLTPEPLTLQASETKPSALGLDLLQVIEVKGINHIIFLSVHWGGERKEKEAQCRY